MEHHDEMLKGMEEGGNVDLIYIDFAKQYKNMYHAKFMNRMQSQFRITGKLGKCIQKNFFSHQNMQVLVNVITSEISKLYLNPFRSHYLDSDIF